MKHAFLFFLLSVSSAFQPVAPSSGTGVYPRNIILLIGDGMGLSQLSAAMYETGKPLHIQDFPITGVMKTHAARHRVTDSAAAATAMACGCKTLNGVIGMDVKKKACVSLLEQAKMAGLGSGLVSTSSITHATPAAFVAHVPRREQYEDIAGFFLNADLDLFIGGGMRYFSERADKRNLYKELEAKGWMVSDYKKQEELPESISADRPFAWFSAWEEPLFADQGRKYLPVAAALAPPFLAQRNPKGFFLMIEGAQIDWACHQNREKEAVSEVLDFDEAIGAVLQFARKDGNTLVIVTADHETGGLGLTQSRNPEMVDLKFTTSQHTATMVPVFAFGPGAEAFSGVYDNTELHRKMQAALQLPPVLPASK